MSFLERTVQTAFRSLTGTDAIGMQEMVLLATTFKERSFAHGNFTKTVFRDCVWDGLALKSCVCGGMLLTNTKITNTHMFACFNMIKTSFENCFIFNKLCFF